ncbi:MAG: ATP-binding protein [Hyphomicrobiales bacterium]|nr:ATP-binding protein [Hyphomicrobiales bacterium]
MTQTAGFGFRRTPLELQLLLAALFMLACLMAASFWLSQRNTAEREERLVVRNHVERLTMLEAYVRASESGQRGYLLTGDKAFRAAYDENFGQVRPLLDLIGAPFGETPEAKLLLDVRRQIDAKMQELADTVRVYEAGQREEAMALVRSGQGLRTMTAVETGIRNLRAEMQRRLYENQRTTEGLETALFYLNLFGAVLIVASASSASYLLWRSNLRLEAAQQELELSNDNLEQIVQERTRSLQEANEEIQRFAYIVSHDLRSPLVNIMGFTTELETLSKDLFPSIDGDAPDVVKPDQTRLREDFEEALGFIKSSIGKMDRLIGAILKISREGARPIRPETIDMDQLVAGIAASMQHQTQALGASIEVGPLPMVQSDRLALEQIFSNLLDNALKFLRPDQPGAIKVAARKIGKRVEFQVSDNGRGIAPGDKTRIFELFRRAGAQDRPGEGLGLAAVLTLVRRLGGTIRVESDIDAGATFYITIPQTWSDQTKWTM